MRKVGQRCIFALGCLLLGRWQESIFLLVSAFMTLIPLGKSATVLQFSTLVSRGQAIPGLPWALASNPRTPVSLRNLIQDPSLHQPPVSAQVPNEGQFSKQPQPWRCSGGRPECPQTLAFKASSHSWDSRWFCYAERSWLEAIQRAD